MLTVNHSDRNATSASRHPGNQIQQILKIPRAPAYTVQEQRNLFECKFLLLLIYILRNSDCLL